MFHLTWKGELHYSMRLYRVRCREVMMEESDGKEPRK